MRREWWAVRLGATGLYLFAGTAWLSTALAHVALAAMLVALLLAGPDVLRVFARDPLCRLLGISVLYVGFLAGRSACSDPQSVLEQAGAASDWIKLWGFLLVAWWANSQERVERALTVALVGFTLSLLAAIWKEGSLHLLDGSRWGFGRPAIASGLYTATALLGMLIFFPRSVLNYRIRRIKLLAILLWCTLTALFLEGIIASQSRGTWLAVAIVFPVVLLLWVRGHSPNTERPALWLGLLAVVLVVGVIYFNLASIARRLAQEVPTLARILSEGLQGWEPANSVAYRAHLYWLAWRNWPDHPWVGWGLTSTPEMIAQSGIEAIRMYKDLHSAYLEILMRMGLVGATLFMAGAWYLVRGLRQARRNGFLRLDTFLFLLGTLALNLVWSAFDFRMVHADWRFYWILFAGLSYAGGLRRQASPQLKSSQKQ